MIPIYVRNNLEGDLKSWFKAQLPLDHIIFENWIDIPNSLKGIVVIFNPTPEDFNFIDEKSDSELSFVIGSNDFLDLAAKIKKLCSPLKILRILDLQAPLEILGINFRGLLKERKENDLSSMAPILNNIVGTSLGQMHEIKKLHEKLVPLRHEVAKNVSFYSKYAAGSSSGGDFFDFIKVENSLGIFISSSNSYVLSGSILTHFEKFRSLNTLSTKGVKNLIRGISLEAKELVANGEPLSLDFLFLLIDGSNLKARLYNFGKASLISNQGKLVGGNDFPVDISFIETSYSEMKFERGEKIMILSSGVQKNTKGFLGEKKIFDYLKENINDDSKTLMQELFYQMKKDRRGEFLAHDASIILLEVDNNVIISI